MEQIVSLEYLASNIGAIAFVTLVVQYTKDLGFLAKIRTRLYVWLLSLVVLCGVTAFLSPTVEAFALAVVNSFVVAAACMGTYDNTFRITDEQKRQG